VELDPLVIILSIFTSNEEYPTHHFDELSKSLLLLNQLSRRRSLGGLSRADRRMLHSVIN
jgi:hypothetical protein